MNVQKRYVEREEAGLFDRLDRLSQIDKMGDPLAYLDAVMSWEIFQPVLESIPVTVPKGPGGRPSFHPMFMFKILVIQSLYGLHDEQTQFQILDRRSFVRFLGITDADTVPDQNTIRGFREALTKADLFDKLFVTFDSFLRDRGFITQKGNIIDASFVEVPRQRNRREENEAIKRGEVPEGWEENPKRLCHKDLDARWTKKNNETFYGYKNHVNVDMESKLITRTVVTDASVHDSQALDDLTEKGDPATWLDAGYTGEPCAEILRSKDIEGHVCEKGNRNKPLTKNQKRSNQKKSRMRSRVEHVFGFMTGTMGAMYRRAVGYARNRAGIIFGNLVYNMARCEQIVRLKLLGRKTPQIG
jgi:transposase, IS5 family